MDLPGEARALLEHRVVGERLHREIHPAREQRRGDEREADEQDQDWEDGHREEAMDAVGDPEGELAQVGLEGVDRNRIEDDPVRAVDG